MLLNRLVEGKFTGKHRKPQPVIEKRQEFPDVCSEDVPTKPTKNDHGLAESVSPAAFESRMSYEGNPQRNYNVVPLPALTLGSCFHLEKSMEECHSQSLQLGHGFNLTHFSGKHWDLC